jgi:FMN phosphatase YigB (HAD superfamily)
MTTRSQRSVRAVRFDLDNTLAARDRNFFIGAYEFNRAS